MISEVHQINFETFRDCVSGPILERLLKPPAKPAKQKSARKRNNATRSAQYTERNLTDGAEDLADFVDVR